MKRSLSSLEADADLKLNIAASQGVGCSAEARVLRQLFAREYAARGAELGVLQSHARRIVERRRCAPAGDHRGVERVEDVRPELEGLGLFELPEVESSHDGLSTCATGQPRMSLLRPDSMSVLP